MHAGSDLDGRDFQPPIPNPSKDGHYWTTDKIEYGCPETELLWRELRLNYLEQFTPTLDIPQKRVYHYQWKDSTGKTRWEETHYNFKPTTPGLWPDRE